MNSMNDVIVTLDTDWAPDVAIDSAAETLVTHRVKATWFVTHRSPAIDRLRAHRDLFELGIHPNFLPGSSHGATPQEVLARCMAIVPDATGMRSHALVQSTPIFREVLTLTPVRMDGSILLHRTPGLALSEFPLGGEVLLRAPTFWEDDVEMMRQRPRWDLKPLLAAPGLKVFDFHPIHLSLNSPDLAPYHALKAATGASFTQASGEDLRRHVFAGRGAGTLFGELVSYLERAGGGVRLRDLYSRWREGQ